MSRRFRRVYEINTRVWLWELVAQQRIPEPTLAAVPEHYISDWQRLGIDAIWLMGVWMPSDYSARVGQQHPTTVAAFQQYLDDFTSEDCVGSPYAVCEYQVAPTLGGLEGLRQLRQRLHAANIGLILDFVPNHTACDHAWVQTSPAYYIQGSPAQAAQAPGEYFHASPGAGSVYIAHGRDPFFPAWTDTAQLNYFNPEVHQVMREELLRIAQWCDGVRCDMAMLCLPDIFAQTWARVGFPPPNDFWGPTIATVQQYFPECCFIAEVYWQLQARLQRLGFTLTYDKDIYDALMEENPVKIRQLLDTAQEDLHGCVRFLENHDEPRVHQRFPLPQAEAAMLALLTLPGAVLLHEGQLDGRHYHTPVHLRRRRPEPSRPDVLHMYERLLTMPGPLEGIFTLLQPMPAGEHNHTFESLLAWAWWGANSAWLIVINYAPTAAQCWLEVRQIPWPSEVVWLQDHWQHTTYTRHREALQQQGLYIALPGFGSHLFTIHPSPSG